MTGEKTARKKILLKFNNNNLSKVPVVTAQNCVRAYECVCG